MKRQSIAATSVFVAVFVLVFTLMIADASAHLLDRSPSLRDLAFQLKTPEDIAHYMWRHFDFEYDQRQFGKTDYWQSPQEFMNNGKGDCEDFARFAYELMKMKGITAYIVNIYGNRFAHTVCIFKEKGGYSVLDGTAVYRFKAKNLRDLVTKVYPFWKKSSLVAPPSMESHKPRVLSSFEHKLKAQHRIAVSA